MTWNVFLLLGEQEQYQAVWDYGVHIDDIIYDKIHYQLYSINDFYVEIHYDAVSNKIVGKHPFRQGLPYLLIRALPASIVIRFRLKASRSECRKLLFFCILIIYYYKQKGTICTLLIINNIFAIFG